MRFLNIRHKLSRVLNPALCQTCGITVDPDHHLCRHCLSDLRRVHHPCRLCGLPNRAGHSVCPVCLHSAPRWDRMIAPLQYSDSCRRLIQDFKYNEKIHTANALITHLYPAFQGQHVEVLLPVPLHSGRLLERGFNQSLEIARQLSSHLHIPVDPHSLRRVRATEPQAGLSLNKRRSNLVKAFQYTADKPYRTVAIVDDVITSGSTMTEICKLLQRSGVETIQAWSLARALKPN